MAASPEPRIVKKAGEGYDRPAGDQELPIDINYQKLSEWLTARQKLPADWHKRVQAIQAKISEALKELPSGTLAQLPGGTEAPVDYFRAVAIRDKLAETAERTLFGGLAGPAGTWDKIVKAYENGGVFIGEAAQTMVQNVDYEIPYLRKQMAKCSQQLADADRRHGEYIRGAASCAANYKKECEKLGIAGVAVSSELRQLSSKLPGLFEGLVEQLRQPQLDQAISYYRVFTQYAHSSSSSSNTGTGQQQQYNEASLPAVLPVLLEIRQKRTAPFVAADAANNSAASAAGAAAGASIDWGGLGDDASGSGAAAAAGVDWGLDMGTAAGDSSTTAAAGAVGGISWDLGDSAGDAAAGISWDVAVEQQAADEAAAADAAAGSGPSLDWDIDMSGIGVESSGVSAGAGSAPGIDWGIDAGGAAAACASGDASSHTAAAVPATADASCQRLQADAEYRSQVMDDLLELRAFLVSRASGLSGSSSSGDLLRALAPDVVASTDAGDVRRMLAAVEGLIAALNDEQLRQLLMISSSSRYVDRLHSNLQRKSGQEAKMLAAAAETQARQHESRATLAGLQPKLAEIVGHTRSIKRSVESALSKQFNGRRVNVLGEINNALSASA